MDYAFKSSAVASITRITLREYSCLLERDGESVSITYSSIVSVRISKSSKDNYQIYLYRNSEKPVVIQNWSCDEQNNYKNQSREYALLVRVMHHHLKDKSNAIFVCGAGNTRTWLRGISLVAACYTLCFAGDYLGFRLMNPYVETFILGASAITTLLAFGFGDLQRRYNPDEIPLQFLP